MIHKNNKTDMAENILTLNNKEAEDFFMQSKQYNNFELPEYFDFDPMLKYVKDKIRRTAYGKCLGKTRPEKLADVNFDMMTNKDGKYAVRPLTLTNPYLYYFIVRELCGKKNWENIKECFSRFRQPHFTACAIPVIAEKKEKFHNSTTILNWWNSMEQRSLELSLEYRYMFASDITNCYGSVNPQTIEWALNRKDTAEETNVNKALAENIITYLKAMQQDKNIGMPQGSAVYDIIAEMILGYADLLLSEELKKEGLEGYEILRYRDDYRIFCNNHDVLEKISYKLQHVLERLNFRMNSQKTKISDNIITDSIKQDKLFYLFNTPIFNKKGVDFDGFQKHLLYILMFGRKYPNGGQLKVMLNDLDKRMDEKGKEEEKKPYIDLGELNLDPEIVKTQPEMKEEKKEKTGYLCENVRAMSAIATQIAIENVLVSHYALRIISRMINQMKNEKEKWDIVEKVSNKLRNQPNSTYNQLWLQNMTYQHDKKEKECPYGMSLCQLVMGKEVKIWNTDWLRTELTEGLPYSSLIKKDVLKKMTPVITFRERRAYYDLPPMPAEVVPPVQE